MSGKPFLVSAFGLSGIEFLKYFTQTNVTFALQTLIALLTVVYFILKIKDHGRDKKIDR